MDNKVYTRTKKTTTITTNVHTKRILNMLLLRLSLPQFHIIFSGGNLKHRRSLECEYSHTYAKNKSFVVEFIIKLSKSSKYKHTHTVSDSTTFPHTNT